MLAVSTACRVQKWFYEIIGILANVSVARKRSPADLFVEQGWGEQSSASVMSRHVVRQRVSGSSMRLA